MGTVDGDAIGVPEVLFLNGSAFIFGLGDVPVNDAIPIHL